MRLVRNISITPRFSLPNYDFLQPVCLVKENWQVLSLFVTLTSTLEAQSTCCTGSGSTIPASLDTSNCVPKIHDAGSWAIMTCASAQPCKMYYCVEEVHGITISTTYFQSCTTDSIMAAAMTSARSGDPGNGKTCHSGTASAQSRLSVSSSSLWLVMVVLFTAIFLRKSA
jgi:hypothetical protein